jgi:hypothetical protein
VKLLGGARDKRLQSLLVMISLFISWMKFQKSFHRHLHLQTQMIVKMLSVVKWTQFCSMELGSLLINHMATNLWVFRKKLRDDDTIDK